MLPPKITCILRNCLLIKYIMISYVGDQFQTMSLIAQPGSYGFGMEFWSQLHKGKLKKIEVINF